MSIWNIYECVVTGSEDTGYEVEGLRLIGEFNYSGEKDIVDWLKSIGSKYNLKIVEYEYDECRIDIYNNDGVPKFSVELKI